LKPHLDDNYQVEQVSPAHLINIFGYEFKWNPTDGMGKYTGDINFWLCCHHR